MDNNLKKRLVELITDECAKYIKKAITIKNPLEVLFNSNKKLITTIDELNKKITGIQNFDSFQKAAQAT